MNAYLASGGHSSLGCPFDNGGGVFVHYWSGPQANVQDFTGGSFGPAVMVDGPQGTFFVNYGFRTAYISGGYNSTCLAPTDNAYSYGGGTRQDFVNCYMTWTSSTGVVVHGPNPNTCTNYGGSTMTGPNACVGFYTGSVWFSGHGVGLFGQEIWTYSNGNVVDSTAHYRPQRPGHHPGLPASGVHPQQLLRRPQRPLPLLLSGWRLRRRLRQPEQLHQPMGDLRRRVHHRRHRHNRLVR